MHQLVLGSADNGSRWLASKIKYYDSESLKYNNFFMFNKHFVKKPVTFLRNFFLYIIFFIFSKIQ